MLRILPSCTSWAKAHPTQLSRHRRASLCYLPSVFCPLSSSFSHLGTSSPVFSRQALSKFSAPQETRSSFRSLAALNLSGDPIRLNVEIENSSHSASAVKEYSCFRQKTGCCKDSLAFNYTFGIQNCKIKFLRYVVQHNNGTKSNYEAGG
jgi:hypothetical protein